MKVFRKAFLMVLAGFLFAASADAQKKTTPKKTTAKKTVTAVVPPLEVRAAREKVTIQFDNLNLFVAVLGPIAQAIEDFEVSFRTKRPTPKAAEQNEANKQKVIEAIRNWQSVLSGLETEFRTKPDLKKYLPSIEGVTELAAQAEDSAIAGKFVLAKEPLRVAAQRLSDTLAVMPKTPV